MKDLVIIPPAVEKVLRLEYEVKLWDGTVHEVTKEAFNLLMDDSVGKDITIKGKDFLFKKAAVSSAKKIKDYERERQRFLRSEEERLEKEEACRKEKILYENREKQNEWIRNNPEAFHEIFKEAKEEFFSELKDGSFMWEKIDFLAKLRARTKITF